MAYDALRRPINTQRAVAGGAMLLTSISHDERGRTTKTTDSSSGSRQYHYLPTGEAYEIDIVNGGHCPPTKYRPRTYPLLLPSIGSE